MQYSLVGNGTTETLVVQLDTLTPISSTHARFDEIKTYLAGGGDDPDYVRHLLDVRGYVSQQLQQLSERVTCDGTTIRFDGEVVDSALARHILRLVRDGGAQLRPAVLFMENLANNPSRESREHLWSWLRERDFTLTSSGHIIGYKAVRNTPDNQSISSGREDVTVNGRVYRGRIPNPVGADVAISRAEVNPNREHGCSVGLHVGTWEYAAEFGRGEDKVLTVSVNPRDVVAVPDDCEQQKMRVCRYNVLAVADARYETPVVEVARATVMAG